MAKSKNPKKPGSYLVFVKHTTIAEPRWQIATFNPEFPSGWIIRGNYQVLAWLPLPPDPRKTKVAER